MVNNLSKRFIFFESLLGRHLPPFNVTKRSLRTQNTLNLRNKNDGTINALLKGYMSDTEDCVHKKCKTETRQGQTRIGLTIFFPA